MISKNEYFYLKSRLQKKEFAIAEFELKHPLYSQWVELKNVGRDEVSKRIKVWNTYYENIRHSTVGLLLKEVASLTKVGIGGIMPNETRIEIRECVAKSEEAKNQTNKMLQRPPYEDPLYIQYKISGYLQAVNDVAEIKRMAEEYKEVYEKEKTTGSLSI